MDFTYFYFLSYSYFSFFCLLSFSILRPRASVRCDMTVMLSHISHSHTIMYEKKSIEDSERMISYSIVNTWSFRVG